MGMINSNQGSLGPIQNLSSGSPLGQVQGQNLSVPPTPEQSQTGFAQQQKLQPVNDLSSDAQQTLSSNLNDAQSSQVMEQASGGLPEIFGDVVGQLPGIAHQAIQQVGNLAGTAQNILAPTGDILETVLEQTGLGQTLNQAVGGNATGVLSNLNEIASTIPVQGISDGLSHIPVMFENAVGHLAQGEIMAAVGDLSGGIGDVAHDFGAGILDAVPNLLGSAGNLIGNAGPLISNLADKAEEILPGLTQQLAPIADAIPGGEEVVRALGEMGGALAPLVSTVSSSAAEIAPQVGEGSKSLLNAINPSVKQIIDQV